MLTPSPPIRCAPEGQITVDFGRHRLTVDGRVELEALAISISGASSAWPWTAWSRHRPAIPTLRASASSMNASNSRCLPDDGVVVRRRLDLLLHRPGIPTAMRRR
jgi:hypothetical protein